VDRWLTELEGAGDPWAQSAEHAAACLVARSEFDDDYGWDGFSVSTFLFRDLWEGGTSGAFGSRARFFDQLLEALQRFASDGLVDPAMAAAWVAEMREARADFLRCFDEATPERESMAIAGRHLRGA